MTARASAAAGTTSVLFVCLGNICRSPLAEGVFRHLVAEAGLADRFVVESAGTGAWHVGEPADPRSVEVAAAHGVTLNGSARQVVAEDLRAFDVVLAMDRENLAALEEMASATGGTARLHLLRSFDPAADGDEVPDPYYGGPRGFERVFAMVHSACEGLLSELRPVP
ncbi:MAG: low molecular weight phosphotyrosine protein phosphatase [Gemmatimonadetes bacterium]|nr:low molecular weight phosphotyrosine protein phosphatase [Gemmatimonadota bacterium]